MVRALLAHCKHKKTLHRNIHEDDVNFDPSNKVFFGNCFRSIELESEKKADKVNITCEQCGEAFVNAARLQKHNSAIHEKKLPLSIKSQY